MTERDSFTKSSRREAQNIETTFAMLILFIFSRYMFNFKIYSNAFYSINSQAIKQVPSSV